MTAPRRRYCRSSPGAGPARLAALRSLHRRGLAIAAGLSDAGIRRPYHADLSPIGWHIGHCAFVETFWLHEAALGDDRVTAPLRRTYLPELVPRYARHESLPRRESLLDWASRQHAGNLALLAEPPSALRTHPLMADGYLADFLIQHYAQHLETMSCVLAQRELGRSRPWTPGQALTPREPAPERVPLPDGPVTVGSDASCAYDNERPRHRVALGGGAIAATPVDNAAYLAFMEDGGYRADEHWSGEGRAWRDRRHRRRPEAWRRSPGGHWYAVTPAGPTPLRPGDPVAGLSLYEAEAFARWAGARLPHEHEWEWACGEGRLRGHGQVWEWCGNVLYPYPGFRAFPYEGYSVPWFNGRHHVLRGGSAYSHCCVRRPSFRNFYLPDKSFVCAGLRLAWDEG